MKTKTCKNCKTRVDINTKYCKNCGGNEFIVDNSPAVVKQKQPSLIHALFYWEYNGQYMLAKSKLAGIGVLITILLASTATLWGGMLVIGIIFGLITFLVGFIIHYFVSHPSKAKLSNGEQGFVKDMVNLLLFWQNKKTGEFVLSKTKLLSVIFFILGSLWALTLSPPTLFVVPLFGLLLSVPAFIIGFIIHKITNPYPVNQPKPVTKQKEIPKKEPEVEKNALGEVIPEYVNYQMQVHELQDEYQLKEKHARDLIEKRFAPPQLTYTRFISVVDKSTELFNKQADSTLTMINLASEYSAKIETQINERIGTMNIIIDKLDDLINEFVLTIDDSNDADIDTLFDDMSNLINSVKDYD